MDRYDEAMNSARHAMRERRFAEAIALFEARLAETPGDLEVLLDLGICHLLNRSERAFLRVHDEARGLVAEMGVLPDRIAHLWEHYRSLVRKVTVAALVMGSATLSSCNTWSAHKYSGGVFKEPAPKPPAEEAVEGDPAKAEGARDEAAPALDLPQSAHRYSGGVFKAPVLVPPTDEDAASEEGASGAGKPAPPVSAHRYSGGVFRAPREGE